MTEKSSNNCLYFLPTESTPTAQNHTKKDNFCDNLLQQEVIVPMMKGQKIKKPNINCCNDPASCPRYTPETKNGHLFKK